MLKRVLGVIAGLVVGIVVIMGCEAVAGLIFDLPQGADPDDREAMKAAIAQMPAGAFLMVLLGWALGIVVGSVVANVIGGRTSRVPGYVVAGVFTLGALVTMAMLPHPVWFWIATLVVLPLATYGASRLAAPRTPLRSVA